MKESIKFLIVFFIALSVLFVLTSCSKNDNNTSSINSSISSETNKKSEESSKESESEPSEVPDSLVLRNESIPDDVTYDISHNYDPSTHIDDVELITYHNGQYGTHKKIYNYTYQYDKSTDLWSIFGGGYGLTSDETVFNEQSYLNNNHFEGQFNRYETGSYDITINQIDFTNSVATVSYRLFFDRDSTVIQDTQTFEISETTTGKKCLSIGYTRSMVVRFDQLFIFDLDRGLYSAD